MIQVLLGIIGLAIFAYLTIIAIPVVGPALSNSGTNALASAFANQAQQIQGAIIAYQAYGSKVTDLAQLTSGSTPYLTSIPTIPAGSNPDTGVSTQVEWKVDDKKRIVYTVPAKSDDTEKGVSEEVCIKINTSSTGVIKCAGAGTDGITEANITTAHSDATGAGGNIIMTEGDAEGHNNFLIFME